MKPVVLLAQSKELNAYIKTIDDLDQDSLVEIHKKLLKMQVEVICRGCENINPILKNDKKTNNLILVLSVV